MKKNLYTGLPCERWDETCDAKPMETAERITIILGVMAAACAVALIVALALK